MRAQICARHLDFGVVPKTSKEKAQNFCLGVLNIGQKGEEVAVSDNKNPNIKALGKLLRREQILCEAVRANGGEDEDLDLIEKDAILSHVIASLIVKASRENKNIIRFLLPAILIQPPWATKLLEDTESQFVWQEVIVDLVEFIEPGEAPHVDGITMISRSKKKGDLAGNRAFQFFSSNPQFILKGWKKFDLIFPGTIWHNSKDDRYVQHLFWSGGQLNRDYSCSLDGSFSSDCRVVRIRKAD